MSVKENHSKNFNNQRQFIPTNPRAASAGIQQSQMNTYQRPMQYVQQAGQVPHSRPLQPMAIHGGTMQYSMIPQAQPTAGQVFVGVPGPVAYGSVPPNPHYVKLDQFRRPAPYVYFPTQQTIPPSGQAMSYQTSVSQSMPQTVAMSGLGIQSQLQGQMQNQQGQAPAPPVQQPAQPTRTERPRTAIRIRDPNQGGKDITEEIMKKKEPVAPIEPPSQVITPHPPAAVHVTGDDKIKAEFAAMVAAAKDRNAALAPKNDKPRAEQVNHIPTDNANIEEKVTGKAAEQLETVDSVSNQVPDKTNSSPENVETVDVEESGLHPQLVSQQAVKDVEIKPLLPSDSNPELAVNVSSQSPEQGASEAVDSGIVPDEEPEPVSSNSITIGKTENSVEEIEAQPTLVAENAVDAQPELTQEVIDNTETLNSKEPETVNKEQVDEIDASKSAETITNLDSTTTEGTQVDDEDTTDITPDMTDDAAVDEIADDTAPLANGFDKPLAVAPGQSAVQVPKKKKKREYKDKDTDLMSAFTDKPEEEANEVPLEETEETEIKDEPAAKEETWEDKEIKTDEEAPKAEKRICYDRDFLLGFQFSKEKPKDLPNIELVLRVAHEPTKPLERGRIPSAGGGIDFMPTFVRQGSGGRQSGMNRSGKGGRSIVPKKIIPTNFDTKVELKKSDNAWVRPSEKPKDIPTEETEIDELYRKARGILNKLTPQKFDKLVDQMKALELNNIEKLKGVIDLIFEKALLEPSFSIAYAKLCDVFSKQKMQIESGKGPSITFKRILLNKCQAEFEKEKTDEQELEKEQNKHYENADEEKAWQEDLAYRRRMTKKRSLGNIRFIGELFKLKMLTEAIMHTCITKLLKDRDPESLECLCQLVTTIGKDIDHEKAKPRTDQYFHQVDKIINQRKVPSRIIFMLQDLKDLRQKNWVSRRASDAPKTIAEIHEEAKQEEIQMQIAHQQAAQKRMMNKGGRESPAASRNMPSDEGWNQVQTKGGRTLQTVDPSRLKITKRTDSENISLGPYGRPGAWAQGASGGGSARFGMSGDGESRQGNRFSALSAGESGGHRQDTKNRSGLRGMQTSRFGRSSGQATGGRRAQQQHQQLTDERAAAVESVRRLMSVEGNRTPSPSNQTKLDESEPSGTRTPEVAEVPEVEPSEVAPVNDVPDEKVKRETKMTVEEFIATRDAKEAEICIRDLNSPSKHHIVVSEAINIAIEKKLEQGKAIGGLLHIFLKSGLLSLESFKAGLNEIFEFAEDIAVDIPHIWTNLGGILGPIVEGETLPLSELKTLVEPLIEGNKAGLLMAETLAAASKISNESDVGSLWKKSGLTWESLLREGSSLDNFILQNKMEFTTKNTPQQKQDLRGILEDPSCTCEYAMDWIEKNIPISKRSDVKFIRELATAVYESSISKESELSPTPIKKFKNLLLKYIDNDRSKELQALYAAQLLSEDLKHPKGFLRALFEVLYDEEIISEDSVTAWETSDEEPVGKGNALNSVQGFLDWLKTSEEESHDENK